MPKPDKEFNPFSALQANADKMKPAPTLDDIIDEELGDTDLALEGKQYLDIAKTAARLAAERWLEQYKAARKAEHEKIMADWRRRSETEKTRYGK